MKNKKVLVTGCFDLLHASHILFLNKAAAFGDLYVSLGSDQAIIHQKNKRPTYTQAERKFLLENLRDVKGVEIAKDAGPLGFLEHVKLIQPDLFVINEDGDTPEKRRRVEELGVTYVVFPRDNFDPNFPTSTTQIASGFYIPTRVSLCSGFMDNPTLNGSTSAGRGNLVVLPIEPFEGLRERSGMATSTMKVIKHYFGCTLPTSYKKETLAEVIFCLENPPGKRDYISGTLDSLGIVSTGVNLFTYANKGFFPSGISTMQDEDTLTWIDSHVYLKHAWDRPPDCHVTIRQEHPEFTLHCDAIDTASLECWEAIRRRDTRSLALAVDKSHRSQCAIVDGHCPAPLRKFIDKEDALAGMIMGAGGGGYVLFISDSIPHDGIRIHTKRHDY